MAEFYDDKGEMVATTEFTMTCGVCGRQRVFSGGEEQFHDCVGVTTAEALQGARHLTETLKDGLDP